MINYQSQRPSTNFLMVDKGIDDELSPEAFVLLIKLMKLAPNETNSNKSLKQKTGFSKRVFDRAKKELVSKGYLDTKQLRGNYYAYYIGKESVKIYKRKLKKAYNRYEQNQIRKFNKIKVTVSKCNRLNLGSPNLIPSNFDGIKFRLSNNIKKED